MSWIAIMICLAAALLQFAVLRDKSIVEPHAVHGFRRLKIAAYLIAAATLFYINALDNWIQFPLMLTISMLAVADLHGAAARLFPNLIKL